jgi:catechol 2,3-dioxygenase-like lactoylglutathione lyase family enzyme
MILGYNHAQITVPPGSAERVRAFYGQLLGMTEMLVPDSLRGRGLIWFRVGDRELHVGVEDKVDRLKTNAHLAYEVDDLGPLRKQFALQNIDIFEQPKIVGFDRIHIRDPFGNRVELMQREQRGRLAGV